MIPKSVKRFPACAKPGYHLFGWIDASAGEGRSDKIMRKKSPPKRRATAIGQHS
jgi:hypothetical protein